MILLLLAHWRTAAWAALAAAVVLAIGLWRLEAAHAARLQSQLAAAQSAQASAEAHAAAAVGAGATVAAAAQRDAHTVNQHTENANVIQSASGAAQGLDPALNAAGRRGLCAYRAYAAEPACVQLRGPGPGQRPDASPANAPAAG
jgi:hypothetical protein